MKENFECPKLIEENWALVYDGKFPYISPAKWKIEPVECRFFTEFHENVLSTQIHSQSTDFLHVNNLVRIKSYKKKTRVSPEFFITQHLIKQVLSLVISNNSFLHYCH